MEAVSRRGDGEEDETVALTGRCCGSVANAYADANANGEKEKEREEGERRAGREVVEGTSMSSGGEGLCEGGKRSSAQTKRRDASDASFYQQHQHTEQSESNRRMQWFSVWLESALLACTCATCPSSKEGAGRQDDAEGTDRTVGREPLQLLVWRAGKQ